MDLINYDFLSTEERHKTLLLLHALKEKWIHRRGIMGDIEDLPYYSLGAMSYVDIVGSNNQQYYLDIAKYYNKVLLEHFDWMYPKLQNVIKKVYGKDSVFHPQFGLPGFHIFGFDLYWEDYMGTEHCDFHHHLLEWQNIEFDPINNISYTALLDSPAAGTGIFLWDETYIMDDNKTKEEHRRIMYDKPLLEADATYHKYELGKIFFHSGNQFHKIAPIEIMQENESRITLQGHAVLNSITDKYHLFL